MPFRLLLETVTFANKFLWIPFKFWRISSQHLPAGWCHCHTDASLWQWNFWNISVNTTIHTTHKTSSPQPPKNLLRHRERIRENREPQQNVSHRRICVTVTLSSRKMLPWYSSKFKRDSKELVRRCNSLQEVAERHEELEEEMEASHQQMEEYKK